MKHCEPIPIAVYLGRIEQSMGGVWDCILNIHGAGSHPDARARLFSDMRRELKTARSHVDAALAITTSETEIRHVPKEATSPDKDPLYRAWASNRTRGVGIEVNADA